MGVDSCDFMAFIDPPQALKCLTGLSSALIQLASEHLVPIVIPSLLILTSIKLWKFYTTSKDPECHLPLPPGNMGWPVIGETLSLLAKGSDFFREKSVSYGNVYKTHILGQPTIRVTGAKNVAKILKGEGTLVTSKWPVSVRLILGEGALAHSSGDVHRWRREMIMKAFSPSSVKSYMPSVQTLVREHVRKWCAMGGVMGYPAARSLTFTVAAQLLLGFDVQEKQKYQMLILFEDMLATLFSMPLPVPGIGLYRGLKARRRIMQEIEQCISRRRALPDHEQKDDALAVMLKAADHRQGKLTPKEMQDSALEMLFAGHLPTSSAASSTLMFLGANPKVVGKLTVELYDAGLLDTPDHPDLTLEAIQRLQYLDNVVREILRVAPPVGAGYRKALQTFEVDGCQVPKGWTVVYSIRETQHTSDLFDSDVTFDPDRWNRNRKDPSKELLQTAESEFHYMPFGFGNRSCVGQRFVDMFLKVLIIELVRNASWRLEGQMPQMLYMPVPHPRDNLPLQFKHMPPDLRRRAFTNNF